MTRRPGLPLALLAAAVPVVATPAPARADRAAVGVLGEAQARFNAAEYEEVIRLCTPLLDDETLPAADRAEVFRLLGLSRFFVGDRDGADEALLAYLKLEPDARLDPATVPPDGIAFFEGVRARHATELARLRPRPRRRGHVIVSLLPPFGQFQNEEPAKGWAFGVAEGLLLTVNVTTYVMLRRACSEVDLTCDDADTADALRTVNLVSGGLFVGMVLYGAWDGYRTFRRRERALDVDVALGSGGGVLSVATSF